MAISELGVLGTNSGSATTALSITVGTGGTISSALAGSFVAVGWTTNSTLPTISSPTDSRGNSYSIIQAILGTGTSYTEVCLAVSLLTTGLQSSDTISATASGTSQYSGAAVAFSGVTTTTDGVTTNTGSVYGTAWGAGSISTSNATDLLISVGANRTNTTDTPSAGWTDASVFYSATSAVLELFQYQIVAATGSYTGGGTLGAGDNTASVIAAFKGSSGGSTVALWTPQYGPAM